MTEKQWKWLAAMALVLSVLALCGSQLLVLVGFRVLGSLGIGAFAVLTFLSIVAVIVVWRDPFGVDE